MALPHVATRFKCYDVMLCYDVRFGCVAMGVLCGVMQSGADNFFLFRISMTAKYKRSTRADENDVTTGVKKIYNLTWMERSFSELSNGVLILLVWTVFCELLSVEYNRSERSDRNILVENWYVSTA